METINTEIYAQMQEGVPYKSYKKVIVGQVFVRVLNPINDSVEERILKGDASKLEDSAIVDVWSAKEDIFFRRMNLKHFQKGNLVEFVRATRVEKSEEELLNSASDAELQSYLDNRYLKLQSYLNKVTSVAPLIRLLHMAEEQEKSEKIITKIKARISELESIEIPE